MRRPDESPGAPWARKTVYGPFFFFRYTWKTPKQIVTKLLKVETLFDVTHSFKEKGKSYHTEMTLKKKIFVTLILIQIKIPNVRINILCLCVCQLYFKSVDEYEYLKTDKLSLSVQISRYSSRVLFSLMKQRRRYILDYFTDLWIQIITSNNQAENSILVQCNATWYTTSCSEM